MLKPNDEYGGKGVLIGWETEQEVWNDALQAALDDPAIVQERALIAYEDFPAFLPDGELDISRRLVDCDPFIFNGDTDRRLPGAAEQGDAAQRDSRRRVGGAGLCD